MTGVVAACILGAGTAGAQTFSSSGLAAGVANPTSLQFGPDGRLYVGEQDGDIKVYTVQRNGPGQYVVASMELITEIKLGTPNHNDDGGPCTDSCDKRQVTGLLVTGTAAQPVLYVTSSDSRIAVANDSGLDTNSGVITRMTCTGGISAGACQAWDRVDIVRGLPRSEENHATNGLSLDPATNTLYVANGGNTNKGGISDSFSGTPEYWFAGAILSVDLDAIAALEAANGGPFVDPRTGVQFVHDLATLDDPTRGNITKSHPDFPYPAGHPYRELAVDPGDPWGGNNGYNQAIEVPGGPVKVHSPGYRNPYDVLVTEAGDLWTWDNGPNSGWGGTAAIYAGNGSRKGYWGQSGVSFDPAAGDYCTNEFQLSGSSDEGDTLVLIPSAGFYGGHAAPTRAFPSKSGVYYYVKSATGSWSSVAPLNFVELLPAGFGVAASDFPNDPQQCTHDRISASLEVVSASTNGLAEYTAGNFGGAMRGDLLAASFNGNIYRCKPDGSGGLVDLGGSSSGTSNGKCEVLFGGFGSQPLDVTTQGDGDLFPGTIWAATYGANNITVFEPVDFGTCDPSDPAGDADGDGYSNGDEQDNGTNPCSGGDKPTDFDGDFVSDLNDSDDDADGLADVSDPFALDADNGLATAIPLHYALFNNDPGIGMFGLGFTGLMLPLDGSTDWLDLYQFEDLTAGGTAGLFTIERVTGGDARGALDNQDNGFHFGIDVDTATAPFIVHGRLKSPYFVVNGSQTQPTGAQSYGLFVGNGDQDNYIKVTIAATAGGPGIEVVREVGGTVSAASYGSSHWGGSALLSSAAVDLGLAIDPQAGTAQPRVSVDQGATWHNLGSPLAVPTAWLSPSDDRGLAVGVISTARTSGTSVQPYGATWDFFTIEYGSSGQAGDWVSVDDGDGVRHENGFVQVGGKFYLLGGREGTSVRIYDPATGSWSTGASSPIKLHHFQAVALDGLIYVVGAMTGECCAEPEAPNVYIYDPAANSWITGPAIPASRSRGGGGAVVVNGRIYWVSGNDNGHYGNAVDQVDRFDPATGSFTALAPIPHPRDHFFLVHRNGKLYAAGGRISNAAADGDVFDDTVAAVDVYDIASDSWSTLPASANLPTPRAGAATGIVSGELVVAGGESGASSAAHPHTEALDFTTQTWRRLDDMLTPRHATQAIVSNEGFYVAAGSDQRGGPTGAVLDVEALYLDGVTAPSAGTVTPGALQAPATVTFGTVQPGTPVERTVTVSNTGGNQGLVIEGASISGQSDFVLVNTPSLPRVLAPGATLSFTVRFTPANSGSRSATLTVLRAGGVDAVVALSGGGSQQVPTADLSVTIDDDNDPVAEGASLLYTITVRNDGPSTATDVRAEVTLSSLLTDPSTVGCEGDPGAVPTCLLPDIASGSSRTWLVSVDVKPDAGGNVAQTIVSVSSAEEDPDGSDNAATETTDVVQGAPSDVADLSVVKTADASFDGAGGGSVVYTIVVSNAGPAAVSNASVVDLLPAALSNASWQCQASGGGFCTASGSGSIDELVNLPVGATATFTLQADFSKDSSGQSIVNTAMVNAPAGMTDPDPKDNESTATIRRVIFANGFEG